MDSFKEKFEEHLETLFGGLMTTLICPRTCSSNRYPDFIKKASAIQKNKKPFKIFPQIGLSNFRVSLKKFDNKYPNNYSICFSSNKPKGYWDIATMSMRGITSCMNWNSRHKPHLIGSLVDPYAGVIYIANGEYGEYGETMLARAVVRLVKEFYSPGKLYVSVDKIYYNEPELTKIISIYDQHIVSELFRNALQGKSKLQVLTTAHYSMHYVPLTQTVASLSPWERSCTDTVRYGSSIIEPENLQLK